MVRMRLVGRRLQGWDRARRNAHDSICGSSYKSLMQASIDLLAALAEPTRLGAIRLLWDGREHCVCELMRELGATQSRMSRHMALLRQIGLVVDRRDAQWVRYRRNPKLPPPLARMVDAILAALPLAAIRRAA
jgi:ArsR family transcriptional regulator, arsenate/arsenite/antimonite-responsive transcriptional repressor